MPIALVAIGGAAYCLLTRRVNPDKVYREIDWGLLVLFTGLFVVIGGVEASGLAGEILGGAAAAGLYRPAVLTAVTAVLSNLVSNVPAVLLFKTVIPTFGEPTRAWLLLAMASTLAGNLTILGSVANLIVVEQARGRGHPDRLPRVQPGGRAGDGADPARGLAPAAYPLPRERAGRDRMALLADLADLARARRRERRAGSRSGGSSRSTCARCRPTTSRAPSPT